MPGFPTETDEMFENTLNLVSEASLHYLHVFPYSKREGTPAAKMPQVPGDIIKERAAKLRIAGEKELQKCLKRKVGKTMKAVVEKGCVARGEDFSEIILNGAYEVGSLVNVHILGVKEGRLTGAIKTL